MKKNLELALIGNCTISALIDSHAEIVWCCMPDFDSAPIFSSLLKKQENKLSNGTFGIDLADFSHCEQHYYKNTAIVETILFDHHGNRVDITDFAPRFNQYDRIYRPTTIIRQIKPHGYPKIRVRIQPLDIETNQSYRRVWGSHHIRFISDQMSLRLTTDLSITHISQEKWFILDQDRHLILAKDEPVEESIPRLANRFFHKTLEFWEHWVSRLALPFEWQSAVIRSAITLKLSAYEDTGAIVAAMTTSIPESAHSERNWDYRFCWLRDSFFTIHALNRLGITTTMQQYLHFIMNIVIDIKGQHLQPVFCINGDKEMPERTIKTLDGYRGMGPVRFGNQAALQTQHDVYGSVILSVTQMFFDERISQPGDQRLFYILESLGAKAVQYYNQPDAGLWELRGTKNIHTFSSMMCWAATDRLAKIAGKLNLITRQQHWLKQAEKLHHEIELRGFNNQLNSYTATWDGSTIDASLLLASKLGFVKSTDPRFIGTVHAIENHLKPNNSLYLFRYMIPDDFGSPENAFTICSFWYIEALASIGRKKDARDLFENLLKQRNHVGLLSEDISPETGELWGNFPQTYSMVGIINCALSLSQQWENKL